MNIEYHFGNLEHSAILTFSHQDIMKKQVYLGNGKDSLLTISLTAIRISMKL